MEDPRTDPSDGWVSLKGRFAAWLKAFDASGEAEFPLEAFRTSSNSLTLASKASMRL